MKHSMLRVMSRPAKASLAAFATLAAVTLTITASTAHAAGGSGDAGAQEKGPPSAAVTAYRTVFPSMSPAAAAAAASGAEARKSLYTALVERAAGTYGGAWYDPPSNVVHVAVTSKAAASQAAQWAAQFGVASSTHVVQRSFAELEKTANALREDRVGIGNEAQGQVGIDVQNNQVVVAVSQQRLEALRRAAVAPGVTLAADPKIVTEEDAGCTTRDACDWTVRAGAMLWRGSAGNNVCSVGFTGRTSSNTRYVLTAGHCSSGNNITWGTGALSIGPMQASRNSGAVDAALIRVTNPWFAGDSGGEIYHPTVAGRSLPVRGVAPTLSFIVSGETVCLSANYQSPGGPNLCGVVGTNSDPNVRGMVRVDGLDACPGDSGGGWYWLTSSNNRWAYGVHSRSNSGCHVSGGHSWFSAVPTVKSWAPSVTIETR